MEKISFWKNKTKGSEKKKDIEIVKSFETNINTTNDTQKIASQSKQSNEVVNHSPEDKSQNLIKYCEFLESIVDEAQIFLDCTYQDLREVNLQERFKRNVKELLCLQNEMKNIIDNIKSLKIQMNAVRINVKEQKRKIKALKTEENKARFSLISEQNNKNYKNSIKFERDSVPKRSLTLSSMPLEDLRAIATEIKNSTKQPSSSNFVNSSDSINLSRQHFPKLSLPKSSDRTFVVSSTNKCSKLERQSFNRASMNGSKNQGVTVYLHPINESENFQNDEENITLLTHSHIVTPNPSINNIPWLSASTPSDTTTHPESLASDAYSLSNEE